MLVLCVIVVVDAKVRVYVDSGVEYAGGVGYTAGPELVEVVGEAMLLKLEYGMTLVRVVVTIVAGQMVVESGTTDVITEVWLAGQLVTEGGQLWTVT